MIAEVPIITPQLTGPMLGAAAIFCTVAVAPRSRNDVVATVDSILESLWKTHHIDPAPPANDEELVRRLYLDCLVVC